MLEHHDKNGRARKTAKKTAKKNSVGNTAFALFLTLSSCPERDSNPHVLMNTWPSTMPVYQFQHLGNDLSLKKTRDSTMSNSNLRLG